MHVITRSISNKRVFGERCVVAIRRHQRINACILLSSCPPHQHTHSSLFISAASWICSSLALSCLASFSLSSNSIICHSANSLTPKTYSRCHDVTHRSISGRLYQTVSGVFVDTCHFFHRIHTSCLLTPPKSTLLVKYTSCSKSKRSMRNRWQPLKRRRQG